MVPYKMGYTEMQANSNNVGFVVGIAGETCNASSEATCYRIECYIRMRDCTRKPLGQTDCPER
jgi:hypothetical protein